MFAKITSTPKKVVTHIKDRRGRYCAAAGFIAGVVAVNKLDSSMYDVALDFIEEKGLTDEFFIGE